MAKSRRYGRKMRSTRKKNRKSKSRRRGGCGCNKRGGDNAQIDKGISDWVSDPVFSGQGSASY
jgi:hypothetical protein